MNENKKIVGKSYVPFLETLKSRVLSARYQAARSVNKFVQEVLAQLTWYHQITLLEKVSDQQDRLFYIKEAITHGWSRNVMLSRIEGALHFKN